MTAPADAASTADSTLTSPSPAAAPRPARRLLLIAAAVALVVVAALMLLPHRPAPAPVPNLLEPDAAAPAAPVPVPKRVPGANAQPQSSAEPQSSVMPLALAATPAAPVPVTKEESPPAAPKLTQRFDQVDTALTRAQASLDQQGEAIAALQRSIADLADQFKAAHPGKRAAKSVSRRARPRVARAPEAASGEVLSVDTWNGQPVVTVAQGGTLHFLRTGERLGGMTLTGADAATQRARFGADVVARARAQVARRKAGKADEGDAP